MPIRSRGAVPPCRRRCGAARAGVWWASARRGSRPAGTWPRPRRSCATASSARPPARGWSPRSSLSPRPAGEDGEY